MYVCVVGLGTSARNFVALFIAFFIFIVKLSELNAVPAVPAAAPMRVAPAALSEPEPEPAAASTRRTRPPAAAHQRRAPRRARCCAARDGSAGAARRRPCAQLCLRCAVQADAPRLAMSFIPESRA